MSKLLHRLLEMFNFIINTLISRVNTLIVLAEENNNGCRTYRLQGLLN